MKRIMSFLHFFILDKNIYYKGHLRLISLCRWHDSVSWNRLASESCMCICVHVLLIWYKLCPPGETADQSLSLCLLTRWYLPSLIISTGLTSKPTCTPTYCISLWFMMHLPTDNALECRWLGICIIFFYQLMIHVLSMYTSSWLMGLLSSVVYLMYCIVIIIKNWLYHI